MQKGVAFDRSQIGPKRLPMGSRVLPTSGLAVLRISLLPMTGANKTAILQLNCALGNVPIARSVEGIRLSFEGSAAEFAEEAGGRVMFLAMRTELDKAGGITQRARTQESAARSSE